MPTADISVAIATRDRPQAVNRCVKAILAGDVLPAEIILVDQSRDTLTRALVQAQLGQELSIRYIHQSQEGLSASRNAAVTQAQCSMVAFTDDDCVPDQQWVAAIARAAASTPAPDVVAGRVIPLGSESRTTFAVSPRESTEPMTYTGKHIPWLVGTGGNLAVKREWFACVGRYDERLGAGSPGRAAEDADLLYRLLRAGARIRYEPEAMVCHERQDWARRIASRWGYGHGIGAFCGLWLRRTDPYALWMLAYWLLSLFRELLGAATRGQRQECYQRLVGLRGTARGLIYGLHCKAPDPMSAAYAILE